MAKRLPVCLKYFQNNLINGTKTGKFRPEYNNPLKFSWLIRSLSNRAASSVPRFSFKDGQLTATDDAPPAPHHYLPSARGHRVVADRSVVMPIRKWRSGNTLVSAKKSLIFPLPTPTSLPRGGNHRRSRWTADGRKSLEVGCDRSDSPSLSESVQAFMSGIDIFSYKVSLLLLFSGVIFYRRLYFYKFWRWLGSWLPR